MDWFVRMYYRYKTVSQIVREGYPLRVVGSGWEQTNIEEFPNAEILSPRNFSEIFPLMEDARIFDSLLRGLCPLTDESSCLITSKIFSMMMSAYIQLYKVVAKKFCKIILVFK